jgi:hypothetical protein
MAMRADEEFCQRAFADYLQVAHRIHDAVWESEPNGKMTVPDFHLHHAGLKYSVEVTVLMTHYEQASGEQVSELGIWKATERLANEVEREATAQGILHGIYILTLDGPYDLFRRSRKDIKQVLMDFIASTRDVDHVRMPPTPSVTASGQAYFLQKAGVRENLVGLAMFEDGEGWGWSIFAELTSLVQDAILSKAKKLRLLSPPWVLLLLDRHHLATAREYADVRKGLAGSEWDSSVLQQFHSIYMINGRGQVFPLYPHNGGKWDS